MEAYLGSEQNLLPKKLFLQNCYSDPSYQKKRGLDYSVLVSSCIHAVLLHSNSSFPGVVFLT